MYTVPGFNDGSLQRLELGGVLPSRSGLPIGSWCHLQMKIKNLDTNNTEYSQTHVIVQ